MKSMMTFMKTMMIMPIPWQVWLGVLILANMVFMNVIMDFDWTPLALPTNALRIG